jgi:hypothetical protein
VPEVFKIPGISQNRHIYGGERYTHTGNDSMPNPFNFPDSYLVSSSYVPKQHMSAWKMHWKKNPSDTLGESGHATKDFMDTICDHKYQVPSTLDQNSPHPSTTASPKDKRQTIAELKTLIQEERRKRVHRPTSRSKQQDKKPLCNRGNLQRQKIEETFRSRASSKQYGNSLVTHSMTYPDLPVSAAEYNETSRSMREKRYSRGKKTRRKQRQQSKQQHNHHRDPSSNTSNRPFDCGNSEITAFGGLTRSRRFMEVCDFGGGGGAGVHISAAGLPTTKPSSSSTMFMTRSQSNPAMGVAMVRPRSQLREMAVHTKMHRARQDDILLVQDL